MNNLRLLPATPEDAAAYERIERLNKQRADAMNEWHDAMTLSTGSNVALARIAMATTLKEAQDIALDEIARMGEEFERTYADYLKADEELRQEMAR